MSDKEENERLHNLARFTPFRYQMKESTGNSGSVHWRQREIVNQEPSLFPFPKEDNNNSLVTPDEQEQPFQVAKNDGICFDVQKLL